MVSLNLKNMIKLQQNTSVWLLLFSFSILFHLKGTAQDIYISTKLENIRVLKDTTFTRTVSIGLKQSASQVIYPIFYDRELEEVSDIRLYLKKGKRFKPEKNPVITDNDVSIDNLTSKKVKSIIVPPSVEAKITYTIKCNELMYFSDLPLFSYDDADTLIYKVEIPETFRFTHDIIYKDSLNYFKIDSLHADSMTTWNIKVIPVKVKPDPLMYFGIYKNLKEPLMRVIVVPKIYANREREYLNNWYLDKLETRRGLDTTSMKKIDDLTREISDPNDLIDTLYNYVKTNFKYVAIEIGMGAFVPSDASEVFHNKQGDCKDLSNFLSEALNYKGIKSEVAMASTYNYISDCNFPSLCAANHVICIAYVNNKIVLLDPTDPIHLPGTPVQSILNRSILIINHNSGEYFKVNDFPAQQNAINYRIHLRANSEKMQMEGGFEVKYEGISGNFLLRQMLDLTNSEMKTVAQKHFESVFGNQSVTILKINIDNKIVTAEGILTVSGKIFNDSGNLYLFPDFLPRLIEQEDREKMLEGIYIGNSIDKKVNLQITMDKPFEPFNPVEQNYTCDGASFRFKTVNPDDLKIDCNYEFLLDHIFIEKNNLDSINEILQSFKKITNEPIRLKKIH